MRSSRCVLALFGFVVFEVVEHRLASEIDRQLRIDFDVVEAQLDLDRTGEIRWLVQGAHGDEGFARLSAWFEVWSEDEQLFCGTGQCAIRRSKSLCLHRRSSRR